MSEAPVRLPVRDSVKLAARADCLEADGLAGVVHVRKGRRAAAAV